MSGRGGKRRQVLQMGNASKLHRYGYSKEFHSKNKKGKGTITPLVDFSDSSSDDNGDVDESVAEDVRDEEEDLTLVPPALAGDLTSTPALPDRLDGSAMPEKPSDMDDELKNFLSEIEAIPMPTNGTEQDVPADPDTNLDGQNEAEQDVQKPATKTRPTNNHYSMFVKGESEFVHSPKAAENSHMEPKEEDFPEEPRTNWQMVQDESTQFYYYWNTVTNEVTWEIPTDYTQFLLLHREYEEKIAKYTPEQIEKLKEKHAKTVIKDAGVKHLSHDSLPSGKEVMPNETQSSTTLVTMGPERRPHKATSDSHHGHVIAREVSPSKSLSPHPEIGQESRHHKHKKEKRSHHKKKHKRKHGDLNSDDEKNSPKMSDSCQPQLPPTQSSVSVMPGYKLLSIVPYLSDQDDSDEAENSDPVPRLGPASSSVTEPKEVIKEPVHEEPLEPELPPKPTSADSNIFLANDASEPALLSQNIDALYPTSLLLLPPPPPPPPQEEEPTVEEIPEDVPDIEIIIPQKVDEPWAEPCQDLPDTKIGPNSEKSLDDFTTVAEFNHSTVAILADKEVNEIISTITDPINSTQLTENEPNARIDIKQDSIILDTHNLKGDNLKEDNLKGDSLKEDSLKESLKNKKIVKEVIDMFAEYVPLQVLSQSKAETLVDKSRIDTEIHMKEVIKAVEPPEDVIEEGEILDVPEKEAVVVKKDKHAVSGRSWQNVPEKTRTEACEKKTVKSINIVGYASDDEEEEGEVREKVIQKEEKHPKVSLHKEKKKKERKRESKKHGKDTETNLTITVDNRVSKKDLTTTVDNKLSKKDLTTTVDNKLSKKDLTTTVDNRVSKKDLTTTVDNKLSKKDLTTTVDNKLSKKDLTTTVDNKVSKKDLTTTVDNRVSKKDLTTTVDNKLSKKDLTTTVDNKLSKKDLTTTVDNKVSKKDLTTLVDNKLSKKDLTTLVDNKVSKKDLTTTVDNKVSKKDLTTTVDNKVSKKDLTTTVDNKVSKKDLTTTVDNKLSKKDLTTTVDNKLSKKAVNKSPVPSSQATLKTVSQEVAEVAVKIPEQRQIEEDDDDVDLEFDLDDIDRALEVALEKKLEKKKVELQAMISDNENRFKDEVIHVTESGDLTAKQLTSDVAACQAKNLDNKEASADKDSPLETIKPLQDSENKADTDETKCVTEIKEMAELALNKLEFLDISTENLSRLQVLFIELQTRHTDWTAGGLSTQYFYDQLKIAEGLLEQYELSAVPSGWACQWDRANNRYYYRNTVTNRIQWEYPDGESKDKEEPPEEVAVNSDEPVVKVRTKGSEEHRRSTGSGSGRTRKKDDKEKSKHDRRSSSHRYHRKRRRGRDQSNSSNSSEDSQQHRRHRKSKKKKKHREERSLSVEIVECIDMVDLDEIEDTPNSLHHPASPSLPPASDSPTIRTPPDVTDALNAAPDEHPSQPPLEDPLTAMLVNQEMEGEDIAANTTEEPTDVVNPVVISKPPQMLIHPTIPTGLNQDGHPPSDLYPNPQIIASAPVAFYPSYTTAQPITDQALPSTEMATELSETSIEADKLTKKKKKDKKSLATGSSIMMKKKHMSSMVQKWQKVKIEVEKEDRAKELRQAAIRKKIEELKNSDKPA